MSPRIRLVLAFLVLSIAPLGAMTWYAYASSARALDEAVQRETDVLARELGRRARLAADQSAASGADEADEEWSEVEVDAASLVADTFVAMPARRDDIPFAIDRSGRLHARTDVDRAQLAGLDAVLLDPAAGVTRWPGWIIAASDAPDGLDVRLGLARPTGQTVRSIEATLVRGTGLGLLLLIGAVIAALPLSSRLTCDRTPDRIRRELERGREVQRHLLPRALNHPAIHIAAASTPAGEVGGDLCDFLTLPDGRIAIVIGDVSGKGVGAGLLMAHLHASLRTRLSLGQDLVTLIEDLDTSTGETTGSSAYATLCVAIFDPATRRLRYVNAGHHTPCVRRATGHLDRLDPSGLPIGLLPGRPYEAREVALDTGDTLVFYTDGCVEAEDESGRPFGVDRLERLIRSTGGQDAPTLLSDVCNALAQFRGRHESTDDATVMVAVVAYP